MEERSFWKINVRWEEKKKVFKVQVVEIKSATMMKNVFSDKLTFKKMLLRGGEVIRGWKFVSFINYFPSNFLLPFILQKPNKRNDEKMRGNVQKFWVSTSFNRSKIHNFLQILFLNLKNLHIQISNPILQQKILIERETNFGEGKDS